MDMFDYTGMALAYRARDNEKLSRAEQKRLGDAIINAEELYRKIQASLAFLLTVVRDEE